MFRMVEIEKIKIKTYINNALPISCVCVYVFDIDRLTQIQPKDFKLRFGFFQVNKKLWFWYLYLHWERDWDWDFNHTLIITEMTSLLYLYFTFLNIRITHFSVKTTKILFYGSWTWVNVFTMLQKIWSQGHHIWLNL